MMRETKMKSIFITTLIVISLLFLIFFNYYYYIVSPQMIETEKVEEVVSKFEVKENKEVEFYSRYNSDKQYYSAYDKKHLYLFDDQGILLKDLEHHELLFEKLDELLEKQIPESTLAFALYEKDIVGVLITPEEDIYIDLDTMQEIFKFRKGI